MPDSIVGELEHYIVEKIIKQPGRTIAPDAALLSTGLIDSFSLVDLALFVEDTYGVHLDDTELNAQTFNTLEQLVALIETRRSQ